MCFATVYRKRGRLMEPKKDLLLADQMDGGARLGQVSLSGQLRARATRSQRGACSLGKQYRAFAAYEGLL